MLLCCSVCVCVQPPAVEASEEGAASLWLRTSPLIQSACLLSFILALAHWLQQAYFGQSGPPGPLGLRFIPLFASELLSLPDIFFELGKRGFEKNKSVSFPSNSRPSPTKKMTSCTRAIRYGDVVHEHNACDEPLPREQCIASSLELLLPLFLSDTHTCLTVGCLRSSVRIGASCTAAKPSTHPQSSSAGKENIRPFKSFWHALR